MTGREIEKVLMAHKIWIECDKDGKKADLSGADLRWADLSGADLRWADLSSANLSSANLSSANLSWADLRWADLSSANLSGADLRWADLSGAKGLISAIDFIAKNFEKTDKGYLAYKTFNTMFKAPPEWKIKAGYVISENVQFDRCCECGCGINVAPLEWVRKRYDADIWKVLIRWEWLTGVCVPYNSDGKIRCERVELLEVVK